MKKRKRLLSLGLAALMAVSLSACGNGSSQGDGATAGTDSSAPKTSTGSTEAGAGNETGNTAADSGLPQFADIKLGEDYTDLKADIKMLTHKTDVVDTKFAEYVTEFQKLYPNINVTYEGITNYADDMTMRLTNDSWGDICMIPTTVDKSELPNQFISFGDTATLENNYIMLNNYAYEGQVYGIPSMGNVQGIVYNKKVFADAGVTEVPKTPDEFLDALQKIKDNTDAVPLYTNFAAGWTMGAWNAYIAGSATGDPNFTNDGLTKGENPFQKHDDMTGPYAVYYTLYEAVARGLTEDDPTTTDWEGSKGMINNGQIGCMVLGSWAITQMQAGGSNPDDIAYMSFPITVNGKQYAAAGPDYNYGINVHASDNNKLAAMIYVKWLVEKSGFAVSEGGMSVVKDDPLPDTLKDFQGVELVMDNPAPAGEETLFNDINNESELGINVANEPIQGIVEDALQGTRTLDEIMEDWNQKWTAAQENFGVTPAAYDYIAAISK